MKIPEEPLHFLGWCGEGSVVVWLRTFYVFFVAGNPITLPRVGDDGHYCHRGQFRDGRRGAYLPESPALFSINSIVYYYFVNFLEDSCVSLSRVSVSGVNIATVGLLEWSCVFSVSCILRGGTCNSHNLTRVCLLPGRPFAFPSLAFPCRPNPCANLFVLLVLSPGRTRSCDYGK